MPPQPYLLQEDIPQTQAGEEQVMNLKLKESTSHKPLVYHFKMTLLCTVQPCRWMLLTWVRSTAVPTDGWPEEKVFWLKFNFCTEDVLYCWKISDVASVGKPHTIGLCASQCTVLSSETTTLSSQGQTAATSCSSVLRAAEPKMRVTQSR